MFNILITNLNLNNNKKHTIDFVYSNSKFIIYKAEIQINDNILDSLAFNAYLWFKQSNQPLYVYKFKTKNNLIIVSDIYDKIMNFGLFNDDTITSTDKRAIPNDSVKYTSNQLFVIFENKLKNEDSLVKIALE